MMQLYYFKNQNEQLLGAWHGVESEQQGCCLIISPFAEEKNVIRRIEYSLCRDLEENGYSSLRFDFRGTGDSGGGFEDFDLNDDISDIEAAWRQCTKKMTPVIKGVLGFRWGANLALLAANSIKPDFIIAITPILNMKKYMKEILRKNVASQLGLYGKVIKTSPQLVEDMKAGGFVNYDGYLLSNNRYMQMLECRPRIDGIPILLINPIKTQIPQNSFIDTANENITLKNIKLPPFWNEQDIYYSHVNSITDLVLNWIENGFH